MPEEIIAAEERRMKMSPDVAGSVRVV